MSFDPMELIAAAREAGALTIRTDPPFRWASGAMMPVYNDNRILMATPRGRRAVINGFADVIAEEGLEFDAVAGTASAGIAPATLLAERFGCPLYYVRSESKGHGRQRLIEGAPDARLDGLRVLLIEDLISTGGSSARAAEALIAAGAAVTACLAIFSYGFAGAAERLRALPGSPGVRVLASVTDLIQDGRVRGWLSAEDGALLDEWLADPFGWWDARQGTMPVPAVKDTASGLGRAAGKLPEFSSDAAEARAGEVAERLRTAARSAGHLLCVGLDPRPEMLPSGIGVAEFLADVLAEIASVGLPPAAFKPNVAYFHQLDRPLQGDFSGTQALAETITAIRDLLPGVPVILDAKRADISESSAAYAREAFGSWQSDALTVSPFMGDDSVGPFLRAAAEDGTPRWVYVLNRTSNAGARRFQDETAADSGRPLYETVGEAIQAWQREYGTAGAVIGATAPEELERLLRLHSAFPVPVLVPGVGAQGGSAAAVMAAISRADYPASLVRIAASRQILAPWGDRGAPADWRTAVRTSYARLAEECAWRG